MEKHIDTYEDLLDSISFDKFITQLTGMDYNDFQKEFGSFGNNDGVINDSKSDLE